MDRKEKVGGREEGEGVGKEGGGRVRQVRREVENEEHMPLRPVSQAILLHCIQKKHLFDGAPVHREQGETAFILH